MIITLNFDDQSASSMCLGRIGEHNATVLDVTCNFNDSRAVAYRLAFQCGGKSYHSEVITSLPIQFSLPQALTLAPRMSIQVVAYDTDGNYIGKSAKMSGFYFAPSIGTASEIEKNEPSIDAELTALELRVSALEEGLSDAEIIEVCSLFADFISDENGNILGADSSTAIAF